MTAIETLMAVTLRFAVIKNSVIASAGSSPEAATVISSHNVRHPIQMASDI